MNRVFRKDSGHLWVKGDYLEVVHEVILGIVGLDLNPFQLMGGGLCQRLPKIRMHDMMRARNPLPLVGVLSSIADSFHPRTFLCQKPDAWRAAYPKYYGVNSVWGTCEIGLKPFNSLSSHRPLCMVTSQRYLLCNLPTNPPFEPTIHGE